MPYHARTKRREQVHIRLLVCERRKDYDTVALWGQFYFRVRDVLANCEWFLKRSTVDHD